MKIISGKQSESIRKNYIDNFLRKTEEDCKKGNLEYNGYFWENLSGFNLITESECFDFLNNRDRIYLLWDIYLKHVHIYNEKNSYPKESIILLSADELKEKLNTFPEDIYLFDNTYSWTIVLTHESNLDNSRFCLINDKNLKIVY